MEATLTRAARAKFEVTSDKGQGTSITMMATIPFPAAGTSWHLILVI
jgi:hypothetical protein